MDTRTNERTSCTHPDDTTGTFRSSIIFMSSGNPYNPGQGKFVNLVLSLTMLLVFLGLGFLFLFTNTMIDRFPKPNRTYIGFVLVGWAVFRGISVWLRFKRIKDEQNE